MITFRCSCGKLLTAQDDRAGGWVRCPACDGVVAVVGDDEPSHLADTGQSDQDERWVHSDGPDTGGGPAADSDLVSSDSSASASGFLDLCGQAADVLFAGMAWLLELGFWRVTLPAAYIWTAILFFQHWGTFWGILAFLLPISPLVAAVLCFWWGEWFYILLFPICGFSLWGAGAFREHAGARPPRLDFLVWLASFSGLVWCFGDLAWGFYTRPTPVTPEFREELAGAATAAPLWPFVLISCICGLAAGFLLNGQGTRRKGFLYEMIIILSFCGGMTICPVEVGLRCGFSHGLALFLVTWLVMYNLGAQLRVIRILSRMGRVLDTPTEVPR